MKAPKLTGCRCQCVVCGDHFGNAVGFDRHRIGDYEVSRRCLTAQEMTGRGWIRNERGFWLTPDPRRAGVALQGHNATPTATHVGVTP